MQATPQLPEGLKDLRLWLEVEAWWAGAVGPAITNLLWRELHQECAPEAESVVKISQVGFRMFMDVLSVYHGLPCHSVPFPLSDLSAGRLKK